MSSFTKTLDKAIKIMDSKNIKIKDTRLVKTLKKANGYGLHIIEAGHGERIILTFPGETINNPHMWLGSPTQQNISKATQLFNKFSKIKTHDDKPRFKNGDWIKFRNNIVKITNIKTPTRGPKEFQKPKYTYVDMFGYGNSSFVVIVDQEARKLKGQPKLRFTDPWGSVWIVEKKGGQFIGKNVKSNENKKFDESWLKHEGKLEYII